MLQNSIESLVCFMEDEGLEQLITSKQLGNYEVTIQIEQKEFIDNFNQGDDEDGTNLKH